MAYIYGCFSQGGGDGQNHATKGVSDFSSPYLHNVGMLTPKPIYILKALEKGFQNMCGLVGQCHL